MFLVRSSFLCAFSASVFSTVSLADRDPVGETAYYGLDRSSSRTSSIITGGETTAKVEQDNGDDTYLVNLDYSLKTALGGKYRGNQPTDVPSEYFSEAFLETLRKDMTYETNDFKIKHLGFADVTTMAGHSYSHCDQLLIYDINTNKILSLVDHLANAFNHFSGEFSAYGDIEDLEVLAHVSYGVPVLGAVQLDLKGKAKGVKFKAGFDYYP